MKSEGSGGKPNTVSELGVILTENGMEFSVWAPNADDVSVVGDFNDWNGESNRATKSDDGIWSVSIPDARLGQKYKYRITRGDATFDRVDPRAKKVVNSAGEGIIWNPDFSEGPHFEPPTLDSLVVYELHIGTFATDESSPVGTFAAAQAKLPYLKELGVNAIEIMPVAEFAGDVSWGYNPAHPFAVESAYGGPEAFRALVDAAHETGIAVILDVVYNHFGPSDLSIWQFDGWEENGKGGIYFYNDWKAQTPWGETRPDYGRSEVRNYIKDNALMWMRDFRVDGLRWDMTVFIRTAQGRPDDPGDDLKDGWRMMQEVNEAVRAEFPKAITIAEDLRDSEWLVKEIGAGGAGFSSQWSASFVHPIRQVMATVEDDDRSLDAVAGALQQTFDGDAFKRVVYSESHDEVANGQARLPSEIDEGTPDSFPARKRSLLAATLVMTAPGVPMLFQGQEFLEDEWFRDTVPLRWEKLEENGSIHACYRDLIALRLNRRKTTFGLTGTGLQVHHINHESKVIAYQRWREGGSRDTVIVVLNLSSEDRMQYRIGVPFAGQWLTRLNTDSSAYSGDFEDTGDRANATLDEQRDGMDVSIEINLGPYSALVLSQD